MSKFFGKGDEKVFLASWETMNRDIMGLPLSAVKELLEYAVSVGRGQQMVLRLYMRYSKLRRIEEVENLKRGVLPWSVQLQSTSRLKV